nr:immunoglobulin light chain junction region [Macaca mulatta]
DYYCLIWHNNPWVF